jgi:hypothetical protein
VEGVFGAANHIELMRVLPVVATSSIANHKYIENMLFAVLGFKAQPAFHAIRTGKSGAGPVECIR